MCCCCESRSRFNFADFDPSGIANAVKKSVKGEDALTQAQGWTEAMGNFDPTGWVSAAAAFMKPSCDIEEEKAEQTLELKYGLKEVTNNAWLGLCGYAIWGVNSGIGVYAITNKELARTRGIWELAPIGTTGRYYLMEKTQNSYLGTMEGSSSTGRCTTSGCTCLQTWGYPQTITDYCGNPDNDPGGPWCIVVSKSCQGPNWGYCAAPGTCGGALGHCGASQRRLAGRTTPAEWVKEDSGTEGQFYLKHHLSGTYLGLCGSSSTSSQPGCSYAGESYGVYGMSLISRGVWTLEIVN